MGTEWQMEPEPLRWIPVKYGDRGSLVSELVWQVRELELLIQEVI